MTRTHPQRHDGADAFRAELSPSDAERLWHGLPAARRRRRARGAVRLAVIAALAAVVALIGALRTRPLEPIALDGDVPIAVGATLDVAAHPIVFSDGSRLTSIAGRPTVEVVTTRPERFVTLLARGSIAVEVTPGGPRTWVVETDLASIEVVGTGFDVIRDDRGLEVRVRHGVVAVSGERVVGRLQTLTAGMSLRVDGDAIARAPVPDAPAPARVPARAVIEPVVEAPLVPDAGATAAPVAPAPPPIPPAPVARPAPVPPSARPAPVPPEPATAPPPAPIDAGAALEATLDRFAALGRAGRVDDAVAVMTDAIAHAASPAEAASLSFQLGRFLLGVGRSDAARAALRQVTGAGVPPELIEAARALRRDVPARR